MTFSRFQLKFTAALGLVLLASAGHADKFDSRWSASPGHSLVWGGQRKLMAGVRVDGTSAELSDALATGFKNLCVELPLGNIKAWDEAVGSLEKANASYLISINSLAGMAEGYALNPQAYRIGGINSARHIVLDIPGATSVLAVLATSTDGAVQWNKEIPTPNGHFELNAEPPNELDHILLLYPKLSNTTLIDCWEGFDQTRDQLLAALEKCKSARGLQGIVNPIGASPALFDSEVGVYPTSPLFSFQFRRYLEAKYHSVDTAISAWRMRSSSIDSFERLAHLIPLYRGAKGVPALWDPASNDVIQVESKTSLYWDDLRTCILAEAQNRFKNLVNAIHALVDVPVVQDSKGWSLPYDGLPVVDGVGISTDGVAPSTLMREASIGASSVARWSKPGLLLATQIDWENGVGDTQMAQVVDDLYGIGCRGFFLKSSNKATLAAWKKVADGMLATPPADDPVRPLFFPLNAYNPAQPQRLPGGTFWLPSPESGDRIDLGPGIKGYTVGSVSGDKLVVWTASEVNNARMMVQVPKLAVATRASGEAVPIKVGKNYFDLTLGPEPTIISGLHEVPVPVVSLNELTSRAAQLLEVASLQHRDVTSEEYAYRDGVANMERNPAASFFAMRQAYRSLSIKLADYTWIEGESAKPVPIGQTVDSPGCSNGKAFQIVSRLDVPGELYRVEIPYRSHSDAEQEVWLAAKLTSGDREKIRVLFGSQSFEIPAKSVGTYGDGFSWYRLGVTRASRESSVLAFEIDAAKGIDITVDAIVLSPRPFHPSGVDIPDAIAFHSEPVKPSRRKRG